MFLVFDRKTGNELLDEDYSYVINKKNQLLKLLEDRWEYSDNIMIPISSLDTEKAIFKLYSNEKIIKKINIFEYREYFIANEFTSEDRNGKWYLVQNLDKFLKEKQKEYKL